MNREQIKELLPVFEAFANGEDIQFRSADFAMVDSREIDWIDLPKDQRVTMTFPCEDYEYRIKPKAREWLVRPTAMVTESCISLPFIGESAHIAQGWIKVREVLCD